MQIPAVVEDISTEWLNEVLTESGFLSQVSITDFSFQPLGEDLGFLGFLFRLETVYSASTELPASMIIKLPSTNPANRNTANSLRAYERESLFFIHCANTAPANPPKNYYSYTNVETDEHIVIMEDLQGARFVNQVDGVNPDDALKCMSALGELHARYWDIHARQEMNWVPNFSEWGDLYKPLLDSGVPQMLENWPEQTKGVLSEHMIQATTAYPLVTRYLGSMTSTLIHCDTRIENVAFDGDIPRFYDWQLVSKGPGAYDVMYFLKHSMDLDVRRQCQDALFDEYISSLKNGGVDNYSKQQLIEDIGWSTCTIWSFLGMIGNFFFPNEVTIPLANVTMERFAGMIIDFGGVEKLEKVISGEI